MRLVTLDLDGTLLASTVFQIVGGALGHADRIAFVDELYDSGLISIRAAFYAEYPLFLGVPVKSAHRALSEGDWMQDIASTVRTLREEHDVEVWVLTDQPDWAVSFLQPYGIEDAICTRTTRWGSGERIGAAVDIAFDKSARLEERLAQEAIEPEDVVHVGNGTNDVPVFELVGGSVAFNPSAKAVVQAADAHVETDTLAAILDVIG